MCADGAILGAKSRSCMRSAPSLRFLILTSPVELEEDTRRALVVRERGEHQTKYWSYGCLNTRPIPDPGALVVPIQVGEKGYNSWRWVGLLARLRTNFPQASISSCTSVVSCTCLPTALLRECCTCVNITFNPATAGVMHRSSPRSCTTCVGSYCAPS